MRLRRFIIGFRRSLRLGAVSVAVGLATLFVGIAEARPPRLAIIVPEETELGRRFGDVLETRLAGKFEIVDRDLARAAFRSEPPADPLNMTATEARRAGGAIGCETFLLVNARSSRRSAFGRSPYFEAWAPVYLVSSRTGRLAHWRLQSFEADTLAGAEQKLLDASESIAVEIAAAFAAMAAGEMQPDGQPAFPMLPLPETPEGKGLRSPAPYKRIKPEYTQIAALYDVTAVVEIMVDLDERGTVARTEIVRWAGYGLDASVDRTVREMNWMPAERSGKTFAARFLLRYNFKKTVKE